MAQGEFAREASRARRRRTIRWRRSRRSCASFARYRSAGAAPSRRGSQGPFDSALAAAGSRFGLAAAAVLAPRFRRFGSLLYVSRGDEGEEPRAVYAAESFPPYRSGGDRCGGRHSKRATHRRRASGWPSSTGHVVIGHTFDTVSTLRAGSHPRSLRTAAHSPSASPSRDDPAEDGLGGGDRHPCRLLRRSRPTLRRSHRAPARQLTAAFVPASPMPSR